MSYAGITKGLTALGGAMALAAARSGAAKACRKNCRRASRRCWRFLERGVPGMFDKAYRWVAEMDEIGRSLGDGPGTAIYPAAARLYKAIAADRAAPAPDGPVAALQFFFREPRAR
jgi:hypothetical protein